MKKLKDFDLETQKAIRWKAEQNRQNLINLGRHPSHDFIENSIKSLIECGSISEIVKVYRRTKKVDNGKEICNPSIDS